MVIEQCLSRTECSVKVSCVIPSCNGNKNGGDSRLLAVVIPEKLLCLEYPSLLPSENKSFLMRAFIRWDDRK